ncbi:hypothetical protein Bhyg_16749, partial [Pseudolycoriella hygida]
MQRWRFRSRKKNNNFWSAGGAQRACKAFDITEDYRFIELDKFSFRHGNFSSIIEIDYMESKTSYENGINMKKNVFDLTDNPVVELLFADSKNPARGFHLVLGEKLNRLAYVEVVEPNHFIKYNNYSPDLPAWPFSINVTITEFKEK